MGVCGLIWQNTTNQIWDVQLHPDNGPYNPQAMNKWTFRTMSDGGSAFFYLSATKVGPRNNLSIESWRGDASQIWLYDAKSGAFKNKALGKVDFGNGYKAGKIAT